ncbi:MAG: hypothetical protein Q9202_005559 [Teloschistes flavicans]
MSASNTIITPTPMETPKEEQNKPISIHIPPSLQPFAVSVAAFLAANPQYNRIACSAFIFAPPRSSPTTTTANTTTTTPPPPPRLLMLHRAAHDTHYPSHWETPGGSAETTDPTLLHALAREVYEESALRVTRFVAPIGTGSPFTHVEPDDGPVYHGLKLSFVVEVAEIGAFDEGKEGVGEGQGGGEGEEAYWKGIPVRLDPEEHQGFAWATEEEVQGWEGIVPGCLRGRMLKGFGIVNGVGES